MLAHRLSAFIGTLGLFVAAAWIGAGITGQPSAIVWGLFWAMAACAATYSALEAF